MPRALPDLIAGDSPKRRQVARVEKGNGASRGLAECHFRPRDPRRSGAPRESPGNRCKRTPANPDRKTLR
jgi:hypothetical protein